MKLFWNNPPQKITSPNTAYPVPLRFTQIAIATSDDPDTLYEIFKFHTMTKNNITKKDRYLATTAYLFELGHAVTECFNIKNDSSDFVKFHFEQENRIIKFTAVPGIILIFGCILIESPISKFVIYFGFATILASLIISARVTWYAFNGVKKMVI